MRTVRGQKKAIPVCHVICDDAPKNCNFFGTYNFKVALTYPLKFCKFVGHGENNYFAKLYGSSILGSKVLPQNYPMVLTRN